MLLQPTNQKVNNIIIFCMVIFKVRAKFELSLGIRQLFSQEHEKYLNQPFSCYCQEILFIDVIKLAMQQQNRIIPGRNYFKRTQNLPFKCLSSKTIEYNISLI